MENLSYVDFNDLFVIAVGVLMTYIIIEPKDGKKPFLGFLSIITNKIQSMALNYKTRPQQEEEEVISQIDYYLNSNKLEEKTRGVLEFISRKANDVVKEIKDLEKWYDVKIKFHTKSDFLNVISCDNFLFGIFILFIGALQHRAKIKCDSIVEILILFVCAALLHCIIYEKADIHNKIGRLFEPSMSLHITLFVLCLMSVFFCPAMLLDIKTGWLAIISVLACFSGFIAYFFMTFISNIFLFVIMIFKILRLNIKSEVRRQRADIERYKAELNAIDEDYKMKDLEGQFELSGGEGITEV